MTHCPHCAMMTVENQRLRARVEALRSELDAERARTHEAGERYRLAKAAYDALTRINAEMGKRIA